MSSKDPHISNFFAYLSSQERNLIPDREYLYESEKHFSLRNQATNRLSALDNPNIIEIAHAIIDCKINYFYSIKKALEQSLMQYETKFTTTFPNLTLKDFEDLYFVLFGQLSE